MLNSLNNNPVNGNLNGISEADAVIQEVYEPEPDDYNYVPQIREVDEAEIRNLSAIREETEVDTRVYKVSIAFLVLAIIGAAIGYIAAGSSASKADVARKASIARTIRNTTTLKLEGFKGYRAQFERMANAPFSESSFQAVVPNYNKANFVLDMSSEVTSEAVLLAGDSRANPLQGLREYSADTMLLTQLLSSHINETRADADEIAELQGKANNASVTYALQVLPDAINYLGTTAPRGQYANGAINIFTFRSAIEDDNELASVYGSMKEAGKWSEQERMRRDFRPEGGKKDDNALDLPNHLMYRVTDRRGTESLLFADEVVFVDRSLLFGKSDNALERYNKRNRLIMEVMAHAESSSANIIEGLNKFIPDEK